MTPPRQERLIAMGFAPAALPVLHRLMAAGLPDAVRWPPGTAEADPATEIDAGAWLSQRWPTATALVAVGACGLVTRLIAPLLDNKHQDPAVVVVDPLGRFAVPLLGAHAAGAEQLSQEIAALLEGTAVLTGSSTSRGQLALDAWGTAWGWRRGKGDWDQLMTAAARAVDAPSLTIAQQSGSHVWQGLDAAGSLAIAAGSSDPTPPADHPGPATSLVISHRLGGGCRWHPPTLWLGIGCERGTSLSVLERLVERTLAEAHLAPDAVAGLASIDRKRDEPALLDLARKRDWPLRWFEADDLRQVAVPHPSEVVEQSMGTPSVAEASSLLAAEAASLSPTTAPSLLVGKSIEHARPGEVGAATLAVSLAERQWAPERGEIHLVGSGPGRLDLLTADARRALAGCSVWVGYGPYLDLLEPLRRSDQLRREGHLTEERTRCREALELAMQGTAVALISSGDSGIYGMAGLALELWLGLQEVDRPEFMVHPGLSAVQLAAARAGAPLMHDFCTISLSDRLTPWTVIERRLQAAASGDFVVALYNPRSRGRRWQLDRARQLMLEHRPETTPVLLARQLGRAGEHISLHTLADLPCEAVDMLSLLLIGNSTTKMRGDKMVTPRGYPGAELG